VTEPFSAAHNGSPSLPVRSAFARSRAALECAAAFVACFGLMLWIEFAGPAIVDHDGYYHIRWSWMLRQSAPHLPRFEWLPLTILRAPDYVDHHFFFHVLLTPFTFGDLRIGAKVAAAFFAALALTALFGVLIAWRLRFRWFWLALMAVGAEQFIYRMTMTRAPSLSLALLATGSWLILRRRLWPLAFLTFVFVWTYSMFPLMVIFACAYAATVYFCEKRIDLGAVCATVTGAVAGLVINPYFPKNLALLWRHVLMVRGGASEVDPGVEWGPFDTWQSLTDDLAVCVVFFLALLAFDWRRRKADSRPLFFLLLFLLFTVFLARWSRFVEYWPPFAVLFAAFTLDPLLPRIKGRNRVAMLVLTLAVTAAPLWRNIHEGRDDVITEEDPFGLRGASAWLAQHTPAGSLVFNTAWDEFPMLFFYNQHDVYVSGLDPRYLTDAHADLGRLYEAVVKGQEKHPGAAIVSRFGAHYVVTGNSQEDFLDAARSSGEFETVYSDSNAQVLRIR